MINRLNRVRNRIVAALFFFSLAVLARPDAAFARRSKEADSIREFYMKGEFNRVVSMRPALDPESDDKGTQKALYYVGVSLLKLDRPAEARKLFTDLLRRHPKITSADLLETRIADSYLSEGKRETALQLFRKIMLMYPDSSALPHVYELAGRICQELGQFEQGHGYFKILEMNYPLSFEATRLRRGVTERTHFFAVQVGSFLDELNALRLKSDLEVRGFEPYIEHMEKEEAMFYQVRIGHFSTKHEAESLAGELEAFGYPTEVFP